jgi:hypothetical protein
MEGTTLELKYCERCGGLGVRRPGSADNYCERCARLLTRQISGLGCGKRLKSALLETPAPAAEVLP